MKRELASDRGGPGGAVSLARLAGRAMRPIAIIVEEVKWRMKAAVQNRGAW